MTKTRRPAAFLNGILLGITLAMLAFGVSLTLVLLSMAEASAKDREGASAFAASPCGRLRTPPKIYRHVIWIVMENRVYSQIIGSADARYINKLAGQCGLATNFSAESHPSLPNYVAMTSGSTQGISDDRDPSAHPLSVPTIFSQLGSSWRALAESMPANCYPTDSGLYAVRHNPATYFTNIRDRCAKQNVPLTLRPNFSARFTFVTPNVCHDMHSCSTREGDSWLSSWLPKLMSSRQYRSGSTAVFVTWDEGDSTSQHIATLVLSPYTVPGTQSGKPFDHYSMLRTTEDLLGLYVHIGNAASARSMRAAFHL